MTYNRRMARRSATRPICAAVAVLCFLAPVGVPDTAEAQCTPGWKPGEGVPGLDSSAFAMTVWDDGSGPALYAGGEFSLAGRVSVTCIARWDGQQWAPLGSGVSSGASSPSVQALAIYNGELIAAGWFTTAGGVSANHIARWDGQQWAPLGSGVSSGSRRPAVQALAIYNGELIAGGRSRLPGASAPTTSPAGTASSGRRWAAG